MAKVPIAKQIDYTVGVLTRLGWDDQTRLKTGLNLRKEMHAAQERGETPTGYRADWIKNTVKAIIHLLAESGDCFNLLHPDDKASLMDYGDILQTVQSNLGIDSH